MLFTVNDNSVLNDYFNLSNQNNNNFNNVLSPKEGLILGNLYVDEYDPYKNYRPREIKATSMQGKELLKIRELSFAVIDLNLKLDIEPNNKELFRLFKLYNEELNDRIKDYSDKYMPLELCETNGESFDWINNPWPWEGDKNV